MINWLQKIKINWNEIPTFGFSESKNLADDLPENL